MSSREPLWYCHECHSETVPLMVPDPHCAECNGTFVEKIENPADDPRDFQGEGPHDEDVFGAEDFMFGLRNMLQSTGPGSQPQGGPTGGPRSPGSGGHITFHINRSSTGGPRTVISGGPVRTPRGDRPTQVPRLSEYLAQQTGGAPGPTRGTIEGSLMLQYLLAMMQQHPGRGGLGFDPFGGGVPGGPEGGRWGDYVFNQEALDQIITQIMENSQAHPVPATEEVKEKLPREVLEEGSALLDKDCAICKDQFKLDTEDPDEQVIVTLPCKHPFHEPCIMPWLKSSGTCPVCRYQLVPQPDQHAPGSPSGSSGSSNRPRSPGNAGGPGNGIIGGILNMLSGAVAGPSSSPTTNTTGNTGSRNTPGSASESRPNRRNSDDRHDLPGSWHDVD